MNTLRRRRGLLSTIILQILFRLSKSLFSTTKMDRLCTLKKFIKSTLLKKSKAGLKILKFANSTKIAQGSSMFPKRLSLRRSLWNRPT
jgi:hypothetical protein